MISTVIIILIEETKKYFGLLSGRHISNVVVATSHVVMEKPERRHHVISCFATLSIKVNRPIWPFTLSHVNSEAPAAKNVFFRFFAGLFIYFF